MTKPTSVTERPITDEDRRALKEQEDIRLGVAEVTFAWSHIENSMVMVLMRILNDQFPMIASAIYFAPSGIEVRTRLVDAAMLAFLDDGPGESKESADALKRRWKSIMNKLTHLKGTRNAVTHGQMTFYGEVEGRPGFVRIASPMLKMDKRDHALFAGGQKPGMGSNELFASATAALKAANHLLEFIPWVGDFRRGDYATLLEKLAVAKAQSPNPPDPDSQIPQEP
jgi:hypothetical protein